MVQQAGLGHHERSNAGSSHGCAATRPLPKQWSSIKNIWPGKRRLQRARHLEANRRDNDAIRSAPARGMNRNAESLGRFDSLSHSNDPGFKLGHGQPGQLNQFVGCLEDIENGGQPQIKDAIENENI
jgi:hypothetical protein